MFVWVRVRAETEGALSSNHVFLVFPLKHDSSSLAFEFIKRMKAFMTSEWR
jgi:hypothetical protein